MNKNDEVLINIQAAQDAIWTPCREPDGPAGIRAYERQKSFETGGVPWSSGRFGASVQVNDASRRSVTRLLKQMALGDFITCNNPTGARTVAVKLTDSGETYTRILLDLSTFDEGVPLIEQMAAFKTDPRGVDEVGYHWMPEDVLAGVTWGAPGSVDQIARAQCALMPWLARGVVVSRSDVRRHVWYGLKIEPADAARATSEMKPGMGPTLASRIKRHLDAAKFVKPPTPLNNTESAIAWECYQANLKAERANLQNTKRDTLSEIGPIPMSCSPMRRGTLEAMPA